MIYIVDGEVVDTYGGDYTYRYVYYEFENGEYTFYEYHTGGKPSTNREMNLYDDGDEIAEFLKEINSI